MEIWKTSKYYNYEVSSYGNVRHVINKKILKQSQGFNRQRNRYTYSVINICGKSVPVHILVADTFLIKPADARCIIHLDGNRLNNKADNLKWVTNSEKTLLAYNRGEMQRGSKGGKRCFIFNINGDFIETYRTLQEVKALYKNEVIYEADVARSGEVFYNSNKVKNYICLNTNNPFIAYLISENYRQNKYKYEQFISDTIIVINGYPYRRYLPSNELSKLRYSNLPNSEWQRYKKGY